MIDRIGEKIYIIKEGFIEYFKGPGFKHLCNWFWFGLFLALLPVIISWIILYLGYGHTNYDELAVDGLLAVVAVDASVCAGIFEYTEKRGVMLMSRAMVCIGIALVGACVYTAVSSSTFRVSESSPMLVFGSLIVLIIDFVIELSVSIMTHKDYKKHNGEKSEGYYE